MKSIALTFLIAGLIYAQDQTVTIQAVPQPIAPPTCVDKAKKPIPDCDPLTQDGAVDLIHKALNADPKDTKRSYLIHVATPDDQKSEFKKEAWYTYEYRALHPSFLEKASDPFTNWFKEKRIFGSANVSLVYLFWTRGIKVVDTDTNHPTECALFNQAFEQLKNNDAVKAEADKGNPDDVKLDQIEDIQTCSASVQTSGVTEANRKAVFIQRRAAELANILVHRRLFGHNTNVQDAGFLLVDQFGGNLLLPQTGALQGAIVSERTASFVGAITYKIAISKKIPTPLANLRDIIGMVLPATGGNKSVKIELPQLAVAGGKDFQVNYLPSDMTVSTSATDNTDNGPQAKDLSKNTWDNERRYPIDFSLALPLVSYKEATVDVNNGNISAREVKKQKLAAMFDFSPWWLIDRNAGFETKKIAMQLLPVVMVGIPIAGKPLQHPILAGGIGMSKAHFFFGTQFNRKTIPSVAPSAGNADSSTINLPPGPVTQRWGTQFVWGLDFSVRTITDLLKKKQ